MKCKNSKLSDPYLIQRLKRPYQNEGLLSGLGEALAFGGGKVNGGISKEAWGLIKHIWRYDYMGSSEFEFGAVPQSLDKIAKLRSDDKLIAFDINVTAKLNAKQIVDAKVYVICEEHFKNEIQDFIKQMADSTKRTFDTKERIHLSESICGVEYYKDIVGWHELDNNYMFFTDKEMFDKTCELLQLWV